MACTRCHDRLTMRATAANGICCASISTSASNNNVKPSRWPTQYCGQLGKQDNCQVAVSISLANEQFSLPVRYQLYLPQSWADDPVRRGECKEPEAIEFDTNPAIALQLLESMGPREAMPELVVADAGYGSGTTFREQLKAMGFTYVVGVTGTVSLRPEGQAPLQAKELAMQLTSRRFRTLTWREGTNRALSSRFAAIRVH